MFSIVIPVYNEEEIIANNISRLIKFLENKKYEIILANNGSTDNTLEKAKYLAKKFKNVKVISVDNKAPGLAFKEAVKIASYNIIIAQDIDLSTDLDFINKAVELMKDHYLVIGSKKMGTQDRSFLRKIPSSIFIFLTKTLLGLKYNDYSMAAKCYRRDHILKYIDKLDNGTSYVIELIFYAKLLSKKIIEIPVGCIDKRKSKFNLVNESWSRFVHLLKLFSKRITFSEKV